MMQTCRRSPCSGASIRKAVPQRLAPRGIGQGRTRAGVAARATASDYRFPPWDYMFQVLTEKGVDSIPAEEASEKVASGEWVVVDVRTPKDYEQAHPEGSVSVPLFKETSITNQSSLFGFFKAAAMAVNGVQPVEINSDFTEEIKKASEGGSKGIILACEAGGSLLPSPNFQTGKASRSLKAAYRCIDEKIVPNVLHLSSGVYGWSLADLPFIGEYDGSMAGRTPNTAATAVYPGDSDKKE